MTPRIRFTAFVAAGLAVSIALALLVAPWASSQPDGLERVSVDHGFAPEATPHALEDLPTAGYGVQGIDERLGTALAGGLGVLVTFAMAGGLLLVVRRRGPASRPVPGTTA